MPRAQGRRTRCRRRRAGKVNDLVAAGSLATTPKLGLPFYATSGVPLTGRDETPAKAVVR